MTEAKVEKKPLSKVDQKILDEYLLCFNQWRAYKKGHPKVTDESARSLSSKLFADLNFKAHLQDRLDEVHMSADEALKLLADMARGDIGEFMETTTMGFELDVDRAKKAGITKLIKRIKQRTEISTGKNGEDKEVHTQEIELHDAQGALEKILRVHGKFKDTGPTVNVNVSWKDFISGTNPATSDKQPS